ncbi:MAG: hypothetical protein ACF788_12955 [Novipirellula sp. JB048]
MSHARRSNDRRRRVLYSTQQADLTTATAASRRAAAQLREARRPTATYAARVHRRLRGRWFSLVPVKRRTLVGVAGVLWSAAILLCAAHYASVAWPSIVSQPELARPLRLDRPDSFGRWFTCAMLAACAGASLLIYQVRRYRVDDYTGQYRLWRLVLIVMGVASVDSLVSVVDWAGAMIDVAFGKRVALSGSDWLWIVISIGGAVLALRLIAEVRRSRWALLTMIAAWLIMAISAAAKWHIFSVESIARWGMVTSAPLLACTTLFISLGGYLRMLFRQVRNLDEHDSLAERFQELKVRFSANRAEAAAARQRWSDSAADESRSLKRKSRSKPQPKSGRELVSDQTDVEDEALAETLGEPTETSASRRRWWPRRRRKTVSETVSEENTARPQRESDELDDQDELDDPGDEPLQDADTATQTRPRKKRRWFGLRAARAELSGSDRDPADEDPADDEREAAADDDSSEARTMKKRGRFSLPFGRRAKANPEAAEPNQADQVERDDSDQGDEQGGDGESNDAGTQPPAKKRGLGGWQSRRGAKGAATADESAEDDPDDPESRSGTHHQQHEHQQHEQQPSDAGTPGWVEPDDIDWDAMSKTERRKLRKQLKRQGRAA